MQTTLERNTFHLETLEFELPPELEAFEPPEAKGLPRDAVRLLISRKRDDSLDQGFLRHVVHKVR